MELNITVPGAKTSKKTIEVSDRLFGCDFNEPLIHQVVTAHLAGARAGTVAQKTRAEVSGGGKKPWKQKGTGRARAGTSRSPLWRSGGVVFAAKPRNYSQKVNKKMYRAALRSILSELVRQDRLVVVDTLQLAEPKTKLLIEQLNKMNMSSGLIVLDQVDANVMLAGRNLPFVDVVTISELNPVDLVRCEYVLMTAEAIKQLEEKLA